MVEISEAEISGQRYNEWGVVNEANVTDC